MFKKSLDLQLFAEGAAGDGAATVAQATGETAANSMTIEKPQKKTSTAGRKQQSQSVAVKYGKQEPAEPLETAKAAPKSTEAETEPSFTELIKSDKYKTDYQKSVEKIIEQRFKNYKGLETRLESLAPVLQMVGDKYGIDPQNENFVQALTQALGNDNGAFEQYASEHGCSVEEAKQIVTLKRQVKTLEDEKQRRAKQDELDRGWKQIVQQAESTKQQFPSFDLEREMMDERFAKLVANGVDTTAAFIATNHKNIIPATVQLATEKAVQATANTVQANKTRPVEIGLDSQNAAIIKDDPSKLTLKDFRQIRENFRKTGERPKF